MNKLAIKLVGGLLVAALLAALWFRGEAFSKRSDYWRSMFENQKELTRSAVASGEAMAKQARIAAEMDYINKAEKADNDYKVNLAAANAAADRYARTHSLRSAALACSTSNATPAPGSPPSESVDRSGITPDMVAVSRPDFDICTTNTLRLVQGRNWALGLNNP